MEGYFKLPITNREGLFSLVDHETYEWAKGLCWHMDNYGYIHRSFKVAPRRWTKRFLHRIVMDAPKHLQVDHINHVRTDNRKINLRLVTNAENLMNRRLSPSWGSCVRIRKDKWSSHINVGKTQITVGTFGSQDEAIVARENAIKKITELAKHILRHGAST